MNCGACGSSPTSSRELKSHKEMVHKGFQQPVKSVAEFSRASCIPITSDGLRHIVKWKQGADCNALQGRPIQLKIYMDKAKLYSMEFKTNQNHYIP